MGLRRRVYVFAWGWVFFASFLAFYLGYLSYYQTRKTLAYNFNLQQLQLGQQAASGLENTINRLREHLLIRSNMGFADHDEVLGRLRMLYEEEKNTISALCWIGGDRSLELALPSFDQAIIDTEVKEIYADKSLFALISGKEDSHEADFLLSNPSISRLHLATRLVSSHPGLEGLLVASIDTQSLLRRFVGGIKPTFGGYAWVLDSGGNLIFHDVIPSLVGKDSRLECRGPNNKGLCEIVEKMLRRESGVDEYTYLGVRKYVAYMPIQFPNHFWAVAVSAPIDELTAVTHAGFTTTILLLLLVISSFGLVLFLTVTSRREALQRSREYAALYAISRLRSQPLPLEELLRESLKKTLSACSAQAGFIFLSNHETGKLELKSSLAPGGVGEIKPPPEEVELAERALQEGPLFLHSDGRQQQSIPPLMGPFRVRAVLPLPAREEILGVLSIATTSRRQFSPEIQELLNLLAAEIGTSVENLLMMEEIQGKSIQLARANAVKANFVAMISHELRTPLAVIQGYTSLLRDGTIAKDSPEMLSSLETITKRAKQLEGMVNDLLELTRMESGKLELKLTSLHIRPYLEEIHRNFQAAFQKCRVTTELRVPEEMPPLIADRERLGQVFSNLISNAVKFSAPGGQLVISAQDFPDRVEFRIKDNGIGVPETDLERIFDRFYQVQPVFTRKYPGVGLGLSITRLIVELHGGKIWCESGRGQGTTFIFSIPRRNTPPPQHD